MIPKSSSTSRRAGLSGLALVGLLVLSGLPLAGAATATTGAWIFPTAHRAAAVADALTDAFYIADSENPWLQDSFFADSLTSSANISVDLYNPTGSTLYNVQVFAAYSVDNLALVNSIAFAGGSSGVVSYSGDELASGGTPQMTGGVAIDAHGVYQAYFVSYGVGDLAAGSSGIHTIWVNISGDFASGLVVHLDYTAEDANGNGVSGPFTADMNIFDNGETQEPPPCVDASFSVSAKASPTTAAPGANVTIVFTAVLDSGTFPHNLTFKLSSSYRLANHRDGALNTNADSTGASVEVIVTLSPLLLDGDTLDVVGAFGWDACDGTRLGAQAKVTLAVAFGGSGEVHSVSWWDEQAEKTNKGGKKAVFNATEFDLLLQRVALHSAVFTYGAWNGTAPTGDTDAGWVDIGSLAKAIKVFEKKTGESKKVRGAEREDLALWLNIASGAINRDTPLEIFEKKHKSHGHGSEFEEGTGLKSRPSAYDTPGKIAAFLEKQIKDWSDGSGASHSDLKLAKRLARAVNVQWLVPA
jgi:hypothetical protein